MHVFLFLFRLLNIFWSKNVCPQIQSHLKARRLNSILITLLWQQVSLNLCMIPQIQILKDRKKVCRICSFFSNLKRNPFKKQKFLILKSFQYLFKSLSELYSKSTHSSLVDYLTQVKKAKKLSHPFRVCFELRLGIHFHLAKY